jgi:hypothetical protein
MVLGIIILLISGLLAWRWVIGIDYMSTHHPDYKGDDLFGEDKQQDDGTI